MTPAVSLSKRTTLKHNLVLSLACLTAVFQRPYGDCITPSQVVDFANRDTNRIQGNIGMVVARKSPYINVLDGGTFPNGVSDTIRSVVQERAISGHSLAQPAFVSDLATCGTAGPTMQVGSTAFTESLGTLRGRGPRVCVKTTRSAFKGSYSAAEDSMKKEIVRIQNADVRATLVNRAGLKMVVHTGQSFGNMFNGNVNAIDTPFDTGSAGGIPDADLNFKLLKYLRNFMHEDLLVEGWEGTTNEPIFKVIASQEQIEKFRDETGIKDDHRALTTGQYRLGEKFITGYSWEGPYRGFAFGIDSQPLRFSALANGTTDRDPAGNLYAAGQPVWIEPEYAAPVNGGGGTVGARINPLWARATHEVTLLIGAGSFRRRTPEALNGEGGFKWPGQLNPGQLEFVVVRDNDCNLFQDFGQHIYEISRSYRPEHPHHVCAIIHKRCVADFGLVTCDNYAGYSSTSSL